METKTRLFITNSPEAATPRVDAVDLPDIYPAATKAYVDALLSDPRDLMLGQAPVTIGDLGPVGEPPEPEPDVWFWENENPGSTTSAQPRIELVAPAPVGEYVTVDMRVDVTFSAFDLRGKWMDILAVTRGVAGGWHNRDMLAHLAVRTKGAGSLKARAGLGTRMGVPERTNEAGERIHKSKKIVSPVDLATGIRYRLFFEFDLTSDHNTFGMADDRKDILGTVRHQNLPADLATVDIGPGNSVVVHLGAIPGEVEGLTTADFENLEIRMTPKGAA